MTLKQGCRHKTVGGWGVGVGIDVFQLTIENIITVNLLFRTVQLYYCSVLYAQSLSITSVAHHQEGATPILIKTM